MNLFQKFYNSINKEGEWYWLSKTTSGSSGHGSACGGEREPRLSAGRLGGAAKRVLQASTRALFVDEIKEIF